MSAAAVGFWLGDPGFTGCELCRDASALDVSVQAQILELLADIRRRFDVAMLFITHDLRVAAQVCDTAAVMYQGAALVSAYGDR